MSLFFLKVGATLFGSGYVLVSYLQTGLVDQRHWLTYRELLDAIAVGQFTPGPLLTTATFIGYLLVAQVRRRGCGGRDRRRRRHHRHLPPVVPLHRTAGPTAASSAETATPGCPGQLRRRRGAHRGRLHPPRWCGDAARRFA